METIVKLDIEKDMSIRNPISPIVSATFNVL